MTNLKHFLTNDYSEKTVDISLKNIYSVYIQFFPEYDTQKNQDKITSSAKTANPEKSSFPKNFFGVTSTQFAAQTSSPKPSFVKKASVKHELDKEINFLIKTVGNSANIETVMSSADFWIGHMKTMPKLYDLSLVILNIPASSAMLERFFSITGIICDKRRMNMTSDLIIKRCMLKGNMSLLSDLSENELNT